MANANVEFWRRALLVAGVIVVFALASGFGGCPGYSSPGNGYGGNPSYGPVMPTPNPLNASCSGIFTVSQTYFSGTFNAVSANQNVALVMATSPPNTFLVSAVGSGGSTYITVTGGGGMTANENVTLTGCVCVRHHDMWGHTQSKQTAAGLLPKECPLSRVHIGHRTGGRVHKRI